MKKKKNAEKQLESNFFGSLLLLSFSLMVSLTIFLNFRPTRSFNVAVEPTKSLEHKKITPPTKKIVVAEKISQQDLDKTRSASNSFQAASPKAASLNSGEANTSLQAEIDTEVKKARDLAQQGQTQEAKQILEKLLKDNPDHEEALTQLGLIYSLDLKDETAAQSLFEKVLNKNPRNTTAIAELVEIHSDKDSLEGARYLQGVYKEHPSEDLAIGIGELMMEKDPKGAASYLEKGGERVLSELAVAQSLSGNHEKAYETLNRQEELLANQLQTGDAERNDFTTEELVRVKMNIANNLLVQGKNSEARKKMEEMKSFVPKENSELMAYINYVEAKTRKDTTH